MRNRLVGVLFLAGVFVSATAEASPITINFTGTATSSFVGGIATPAALTGFYTFESTTADASVNPFRGSYAAITAFSISVGGYVATGSAGTITIENDFFGVDMYLVDLPVTTPMGGFAPLSPFRIQLSENSVSVFSSDVLPTSIDLAAFGSVRIFQLPFSAPCPEDFCVTPSIFGNISSVTVSTAPAAVPEPGTLLLIGTGLAFVVARRRRR